MTTSPEIIAAGRPFREPCRPDECTGGKRCWVVCGIFGYLENSSSRSSCVECRGAIKERLRPSSLELRSAL